MMKDLLEFLKEGRGKGNWGHSGRPGKRGGSSNKSFENTVYHVTKYTNAENILKHNYFRTGAGAEGVRRLSTTEDKNYNWGSSEVKFVLDTEKLNQDFKLKRIKADIFVDKGKKLEESEIGVVSNTPIMNANRYIKEIRYREAEGGDFNRFLNQAENYSKKFNVKLTKI